MIAMALVAATSALTAYIFKPILNEIFISKNERMLTLLPLMVIALFVTRGIARFVSTYLTSKIGVSLANTLRKEMFARLIDAEYAAKQKITTGDINAVVIQTVLNMHTLVARVIPQLLTGILTMLALIVMILYTDWRLSLYAITVAALIVIPVKLLAKGVKRHTKNAEEMITKLSNRLNESFNHFELVKVYHAEAHEKALFNHFLEAYEKFQVKLSKYYLLSSPFMELFVALAISIVIYIGGHYVIDGSMTAGDFFAFLVALMMLYAPVKGVTQNYTALFMLNGYVERVEKILQLPIEKGRSGIEKLERIQRIQFDGVGYMIGEDTILKDISFTIHEGDNVAIVGKSGAGKSSIISLLFGLAKVSEGAVRINEMLASPETAESYRDQISYVNQAAGVFNMTVKENITYGSEYDEAQYLMAKQGAQCDFIDQMPLGDESSVGEFGNRLSGGQRQRVALARALYRDGSLFVLDEATSALDINTERMIQESLDLLMQEKTSIIIAHRLSTIEKCNKVIVLEAGRIVASGSYDEVSQSEAFRRNFMIENTL